MTEVQQFWNEMAKLRNDMWYTLKRAEAALASWNNNAALQGDVNGAGAELVPGCPVTGAEFLNLITAAQQLEALMNGQATTPNEYYRTLAAQLFKPHATG